MNVSAVVLAAGLSQRMGHFKQLLPWPPPGPDQSLVLGMTVVGQVVATLHAAGVPDIVVVTGHRATEVEAAVAGRARTAFNPAFANGEMLDSVRTGLSALDDGCEAALLCLGDQPHMLASTVRLVLAAAGPIQKSATADGFDGSPGESTGCDPVIVPSHGGRAGHPILLPRRVWPAVLNRAGTLRDVMQGERPRTRYLTLDTPTILMDLDTPADYDRARN